MEFLLIIFVIITVFVIIIANLSKITFPTVDDVVKQKGIEGEHIVNYYLKAVDTKGKILNNLYVPTVYGNTTEIDNLFLTRDAIFVIESKNINGAIRGNDEDEEWESIRDDRMIRFRNPIKQNATHVKYLKKQLKHLIPVYSIIAFNDDANLLNIRINNKHIRVMHYYEIAYFIDSELKEECHFLNVGEFNITYYHLLKFANASDEVKEKHDNYIKERYR